MPYKEKHISVLPTVPATLPLPLSTTGTSHHSGQVTHTPSSVATTTTNNNNTTTSTATATSGSAGGVKSEDTSHTTSTSHLTIVHPATLPMRADGGSGASPLSDDAVQINAKIMQGVEYPSVRAALIARDALHAARKYYDLFYTKGKPRQACLTPGAAGNNNTNTAVYASSATHVSLTGASAATNAMLMSTPIVQTPLHVLNTPYHTFFPPVLTHEDRARIIATILGHAPSRFSRWKWRQAEDYCHLHARNVHHNSVYVEPPSLVQPSSRLISPTGVPASVSLGYGGNHPNNNNNNMNNNMNNNAMATLRRMSSPRDTTLPLRSSSALLGLRHASCETLTPPAHVTSARLSGGSNLEASGNANSKSNTPHGIALGADARPSLTSTELRTANNNTTTAPAAITSGSTRRSEEVRYGGGGSGNSSGTAAMNDAPLSRPRNSNSNSNNWHDNATPPPPAIAAMSGGANGLPAAFPVSGGTNNTTNMNNNNNNVSSGAHSCPHSSTGPTPVVGLKDAGIFTFPTSQQGPEYFHETAEDGTKTLIIIMVGLPARGKTFLAQKICRLLSWHGSRAKVHNLQVMWRRLLYEEAKRTWHEGAARGKDGRHVESDATHGTSRADTSEPTTAAALPPSGKPAHFLRTEHFRQLLSDPTSEARRLYRCVLQDVAQDCRRFFAHGGEVVVMNDDFVTHELRNEAADLLRPLASQLFFMEVCRESEHNAEFNECKVKDPSEYPPGDIDAERAKADFAARLAFLESVYESFSDPTPGPSGSNGSKHNNKGQKEGEEEGTTAAAAAASSCGATRDPTQAHRSQGYIQVRHPNIVEAHGISGYAASRIISYVMNLSQSKMQHPIYFLRHGESCYNLERRIGGDPLLTEQGMRDAAALLEFLYSLKMHLREQDRGRTAHACEEEERRKKKEEEKQCDGVLSMTNGELHEEAAQTENASIANATLCESMVSVAGQDEGNADKLEIWTSQLRRAIQTAELSERLLNIRTLRWSSLNEIHAGVCEGMTYDEVSETYPLIDHFRKMSKYTFRYPDGESYQDLVVRLEPVIMELENADKIVVVVAHQAVLRCLLAYFGSTSAESSVRVKVPHRTVWRCSYDSKGIASLEEVRLDNYEVGFSIARQASTTDDLDAIAAATGPAADDPTVDVI